MMARKLVSKYYPEDRIYVDDARSHEALGP